MSASGTHPVVPVPVAGLGTLRRVVHLADLHIRAGDRAGARVDEYAAAFAALGRALEPFRGAGDTLAVVCGDVFHHKCRIEAHGLQLFHRFLAEVRARVPVLLISGNHDFRQTDADPDAPDMVASVLAAARPGEDVVHLAATGLYRVGGATLGLVAARDTLDIGAGSGLSAGLPPFPQPPEGLAGPRVALFHGTVAGARTASVSLGGIPATWFGGGYDVALLGDIHHQQVATEPATGLRWGYPGSLVQQGFGETLDGHGFLLWDLAARTAEAVEVPSRWGFATVEVGPGGGWVCVPDGTPLEALRAERPHVRVRALTSDGAEVPPGASPLFRPPAAAAAAAPAAAVPDWDAFVAETATDEQREALAALVPDGSADEYLAPETLLVPPRDAAACDAARLAARNDKVAALVLGAEDREAGPPPGAAAPLRVSVLEWSWILCYGETNQLVLPAEGLTMITGGNGAGKSSVFEVLCLALFGDSPASRGGRELGATILCNAKPPGKGARTTVRFTFGGDETFSLSRLFEVRSDDARRLKAQQVTLSRVLPTGRLVREVSGKVAVAAWLRERGADLDRWLSGCMVTQAQERDFFGLPAAEQLALLEASFSAKGGHAEAVAESLRAHRWALAAAEAVAEALARADRSSEVAGLREEVAACEGALAEARERSRRADAAAARALPEVAATGVLPTEAAVRAAEASDGGGAAVPPAVLAEVEAALAGLSSRPSYADAQDAAEFPDDGVAAEIAALAAAVPGDRFHGKSRPAARMWTQRLLRPYDGSLARAESLAAREAELLREDGAARAREEALRDVARAVRPPSPRVRQARAREEARREAGPSEETVARARDRLRLAELLAGSLAGVLPNPSCSACMSRGAAAQDAVALAARLGGAGDGDVAEAREVLRAAEARSALEATASADAELLEAAAAWEEAGGDAAARALREATEEVRRTGAELARARAAAHAAREVGAHAAFVRASLAAQRLWDVREAARAADPSLALLARHADEVRAARRARTEVSSAETRVLSARASLEAVLAASSDPDALARARRDVAALRARARGVQALGELLSGFRAWLFRRVIVPGLARRVNALVSAAFPAAALLSAEVAEDCSSVRFLAGGAAIQKASGFQRWALGLAARMALAGLAGAPPPQLFVDEGFGVCDARHLEMVPGFLRALAPSVLAVSHLEEVRAGADRHLRVRRDGATGISSLGENGAEG